MNQQYIENELTDEELLENINELTDTTYRQVTNWKAAIRNEEPVEEIEQIAEEAAKTVYTLDIVQSEWKKRNFDREHFTEYEMETIDQASDAYRFAKDAGTRREYLGKENSIGYEPDQMNYGDFCLINGNNVGFEKQKHETEIETIENKIRSMNPGIDFKINIDQEADLKDEELNDTGFPYEI